MFSTRSELMVAFLVIAVSLAIGTIAYQFLEGWTPVQAFYFSVTTLTTVGYGDLHPTTDLSMLFTALYILTNVAIMLAALSIIGTHYIKHREKDLLEGMNKLKARVEEETHIREEERTILDDIMGSIRGKVAKNARKKAKAK